MLDELRVRFTMSQGRFSGQCLSFLTNGLGLSEMSLPATTGESRLLASE